MVIIVCDVMGGVFVFGIVGREGLMEKLVVEVFEMVVGKGEIVGGGGGV